MSAARPLPTVELWDGEVVPYDIDGVPLVFWAQGFAKLCARCATEILRRGGRVVVYFRVQGGAAECSACKQSILAVEGEDEGDGDCDREDPWEDSDGDCDRETDDEDDDVSDWENDWADEEDSPPAMQVDWEQFEVWE